MIRAIALSTDFSPEGQVAFAHALRLALANRCALDLLHVRGPHAADHYEKFPGIREVLTRWGLLALHATIEDIAAHTGIKVRKIEIRDAHPAEGLAHFLASHRPDLLVMATHGRDGLNRWLHGSVSHEVAQRSHVPVLMIGPAARPFVDHESGAMRLTSILTPIAHDPLPLRALHTLKALTEGLAARVDAVHVGAEPPNLMDENGIPLRVRQLQGPVVETIIAEADRSGASLIAMPTAGHHGYLDALRGSTTENVVAHAPCPVLALPA